MGSAIVKTLEQDEYFLRTNRIEIPSSDMEIFILNMNPQKHNMAVLGQIVKLIPRKIIESLRKKHKIQTRSFTATSHVVAMIYSQLTHALSLNDVCDGMKNHHGILSHIYCMETSKEALFSQFIYTCQSYIVELSEFGNCTESM